jgi:acyl-CoA synthetase (AMP-forming)/AMP-acid ligase II/acyl carrier protein
MFRCLRDLLAYHGRTAADRDAILAPGRSPITYGALWAAAENTLRRLRSAGVGRTDRVAVALPDGPEAAVTIISVAAGATCVPLNPGFTVEECQRYFAELGVAALSTRCDINSASRTAALALGILVVDLPTTPSAAFTTANITGGVRCRISDDDFASAADDALILLTSGSTSRPKMVPLTHASVCLSAHNVGTAIELKPQDRLLSVLPLFHGHGLISGTVAALAAGSSAVCTSGFDARAFFSWLAEFRPTWYTAVPAIHQAVLSAGAGRGHEVQRSSLRLIRSASSTLPLKVLCGLEALFGVPVIDTFGMTEAATQIAANPLGRGKPGSVGQSAGAEIAILDSEARRLSSGEHGEIAVRGPTITRGYYNDATATASAFRDGWFRTGDLGYLDAEGYLFIVGRIKEIINRGGQKVAPSEVEAVLLGHPDVVEAAVFSVPHARLGEDVGAAVVLRPASKVSVQKLRDFTRQRLAPFKVPGHIRTVREIPKGPGGKIKRSELAVALSIKSSTDGIEHGGKAARSGSALEYRLAKICEEILDCGQISFDQDLFALGADSLAVTQIIFRLHDNFGLDLSFADIFQAPTVAALAARLEIAERNSDVGPASTPTGPPADIVRTQEDGPHPVAFVQERLLRIEQELPQLAQFNLPYGYRLQGPLNVTALERALAEVVRRHRSLRTGFTWRNEHPIALVIPSAEIKLSLVVEDLASRGASENSRGKALLLKKVALEAEQATLKPFELDRGSLIRAHLFRLGVHDHVLLLILHELIVDGWSIGILMKEISDFYAAFAVGKQLRLPELAIEFSDFARWQRQWCTSTVGTRQFVYWKERLQKVRSLFTTTNGGVGGVAANIAQEQFHISDHLVARLNAISQSGRGTLFMTLLTAFKTLLLARTGLNDICVATAMANRSHPKTEHVIGPFANTTLIRTQIAADMPFEEALNHVRDAVLEAGARQDLPFDFLAARLAQEDNLMISSLVQVFFVLQVPSRRPIKLLDVNVRSFGNPEGQSIMPLDSTWLTMTLKESSSGIIGTCRYKSDLFEPNAGQHWIEDYSAILSEIVANPKRPLDRLLQTLDRR